MFYKKFSSVYFPNSGHIYQHELLLYTENCFGILKNIFLGSATQAERLATLYLMYAMYFKQPTKEFCKFRFTLVDWTKMKNFYSEIAVEPKYLQARTIFWRLWQCHAFRFVESDLEHCPETLPFHRLNENGMSDFQKINPTIIGSVNDLQNESKGLLSAIEILQVGYNEMKGHFADTIKECVNMKSTDIISEVNTQLDTVKKIFETQKKRSSGRKQRNLLLAGPSTSKDPDTDCDSELNASNYTYSDSNDESESQTEISESDALDECLNIGSKRYYLKRRAAQQESGELHRFKSSMMDTIASPKKTRQSPRKAKKVSIVEVIDQPESTRNIDTTPSRDSENDSNDAIVINHSKKIYNRHSKEYISTMRKQFTECPR